MKCPHCNYIAGWDAETSTMHNHPANGDFYQASNSIVMERSSSSYYREKDTSIIFGCPNCRKLFIED